jgi:hypothetical protein
MCRGFSTNFSTNSLRAHQISADFAGMLQLEPWCIPVITERGHGFGLGQPETFRSLCIIPCNTHAFAAASSRRLDHNRISDVLGHFNGLRF